MVNYERVLPAGKLSLSPCINIMSTNSACAYPFDSRIAFGIPASDLLGTTFGNFNL